MMVNNLETTTEEEELVPQDKPADVPAAEATTDEAPAASSGFDHRTLARMVNETRKLVGIFQESWNGAKAEFGITEDQISELIKYNNEARTDRTEDQTEEEYDDLNGLNAIPMERVAAIFGDDSKIFGVEPSQTIDRVRYAANVFTELFKAHRDLRMIDEQFAALMEENENASIKALEDVVANSPDKEKREKAQAGIDRYYHTKYITFLLEIDDKSKDHLIRCFTDQGRIRYLIDRARKVMQRNRLPETFILEISDFEKRFMDEKYWHQNNLLLLAFLQKLAYIKLPEQGLLMNQLHGMMLGLDKIVRHEWAADDEAKVMDNLIKFHEMFIGRIPGLSDQLAAGDNAE